MANLDPKSGQETIDLIDKIHKEVGATIEHAWKSSFYRPVDRILLSQCDGELLFNGSPGELLSSTLLLENDSRTSICDLFAVRLGFDTRSVQNRLDATYLTLLLPDRVLKDKRQFE